MDEDRRIRFLVAPVLFVVFLLWGAWLDPEWRPLITNAFRPKDAPSLIGIIAGGGAVVFAGGYIIGTLSYFLLRIGFSLTHSCNLCRSRFHEVSMTKDTLRDAVARLNPSVSRNLNPSVLEKQSREFELYIGAAFDFDIIKAQRPGIHEWMFRRWNAFNIGASSFLGLCLSFLSGLSVGIQPTFAWVVSLIIGLVTVITVTIWAWRDTMNMLAFVISLPDKSTKEPKTN
jgi:hypothetical protein